jgi:hypothetical protein
MATSMHPSAPQHLPAFITAPGESDIFLNGAAIFLVVMTLVLGSVYFRLHALPEHMAHRNANKLQFEVVAVLALLGLLTHNNSLWVAALLLALVPIPDFHGPLSTMARALAKMAGLRWGNDPSVPAVDDAEAEPTPSSEGAAAPAIAEKPGQEQDQPPPAVDAAAKPQGGSS